MFRSVSLFAFILIFAACSSNPKSGGRSPGEGVEIRFKGEPGKTYEAKYFSSSRILTYSENQLVKDRTEAVEFTVKNEVKAFDPKTGTITFANTTVDKDGVVPLHDLAFPEKGEVIEYIIQSTGEVLKAGDYPQQSIFFVPAMPVPKDKVQVGDTWPLEFVWASAREGIPLKLQVVGILKEIVTCNGKHRCADVEVSGKVGLVVNPDRNKARFESRIWGRMLFDLDRGDVTWSQTRSREEMTSPTQRILVSSCMVSETKGESGYRTQVDCEPKEEAVSRVPRL